MMPRVRPSTIPSRPAGADPGSMPASFAPALFGGAAGISGIPSEAWRSSMAPLETAVCWVSAGSVVFFSICMALTVVRLMLLRGRSVAGTVTWDCGYAAPSRRMQYTASSFTQPITDLFRRVLGLRTSEKLPSGLFPEKAYFESHVGDTANEYFFRPSFRMVDQTMARLRWIQEGRVQVYVLYVAVTLLILLLVAL